MTRTEISLTSADWLLGGVFFLSGAAALLYQVCWQRLLFISFGIDIESVTIIVSTFMLGLGVGALAGGWIADRFPRRLILFFAAFELAIGLFGLVSVQLIAWLGDWFVGESRTIVALVNFILLLLPTSLMGATLPILTADAARRNGGVGVSIGRLYFVNTLGATTGVAFLGMGAFSFLGLQAAIVFAAVINLGVATTVAWALSMRR